MWWIFNTLAACEAANDAAGDLLPPDTLADGEVAPVQITQRWARPLPLAAGKWALRVKDDMSTPIGATLASAEQLAALSPLDED
jgi:hypothetical protein